METIQNGMLKVLVLWKKIETFPFHSGSHFVLETFNLDRSADDKAKESHFRSTSRNCRVCGRHRLKIDCKVERSSIKLNFQSYKHKLCGYRVEAMKISIENEKRYIFPLNGNSIAVYDLAKHLFYFLGFNGF